MKSTNRSPWAPYVPSAGNPWDIRKVAHLHRRAGFGATRAELVRDLDAGPAVSVDRFLSPRVSTDERDAAEAIYQTASSTGDIELLKVGWLNRIVRGTDPLREKMTLFWHHHFATSNNKVDSPRFMGAQNETLRAHALDDLASLLNAIIADPAMLVWLDGAESEKSRPNENFAREFLELYTLGPGRYSESDVREAARAFAGWKLGGYRGQFGTRPVEPDPSRVDVGEKTFLGRRGAWNGADIVRITLEHSGAAEFLARKLYGWFVGESTAPGPDLIGPLADEIRESKHSIRHVVGVILRSDHFYSRAAYRQRIKSPVEFGAGLVRMLEAPRQGLNPLALAAACDSQGQELFSPPNVNGWAGGRTWINSGSLLQRSNWAADVIWGCPEQGLVPFDPAVWISGYRIEPERAAGAFLELLIQDDLGPGPRRIILEQGRDTSPDGLRKVLQLILNCPEFQLA